MTEFTGMDVATGRHLAATFARSGERLDGIRSELESLLRSTTWAGPDADALRARWQESLRGSLSGAGVRLRQAGAQLSQQVDEQERASGDGVGPGRGPAPGPGGGGGGPLAWLKGAGGWARDQIESGVDWVEDRVEDGLEWASDGIDAGVDAAQQVWDDAVRHAEAWWAGKSRAAESTGDLLENLFVDPWRTGRPPQLAEVGAGFAIIMGQEAGALWNLVTGEDHHFFDDGSPWTGTPTYTTPLHAEPTDFQSLAQTTMDAYDNGASHDHGEVQVTVVRNPGEAPRYIVSIPGTQAQLGLQDGWSGKDNARDWYANLPAMANGTSTYSQATIEAIDRAIALDQANHPGEAGGRPTILLTGHSQGGIIAANVAADAGIRSRYDVGGVVSFASPVDCANVPRDTPMLSIENGSGSLLGTWSGDLIPRLDFGGVVSGPDGAITRVNNPALGSPLDIRANHEQAGYLANVNAMLDPAQTDPRLAANGRVVQQWSATNNLSQFYVGQGGSAQTIQVQVGRTIP